MSDAQMKQQVENYYNQTVLWEKEMAKELIGVSDEDEQSSIIKKHVLSFPDVKTKDKRLKDLEVSINNFPDIFSLTDKQASDLEELEKEYKDLKMSIDKEISSYERKFKVNYY